MNEKTKETRKRWKFETMRPAKPAARAQIIKIASNTTNGMKQQSFLCKREKSEAINQPE